MKASEILAKLEILTPKDETYSYTGKKDHEPVEQPELVTIERKRPATRPRTKQSQNNSYT